MPVHMILYFLGEAVGLPAYMSNVKTRSIETQTAPRHDSPLTSTIHYSANHAVLTPSFRFSVTLGPEKQYLLYQTSNLAGTSGFVALRSLQHISLEASIATIKNCQCRWLNQVDSFFPVSIMLITGEKEKRLSSTVSDYLQSLHYHQLKVHLKLPH